MIIARQVQNVRAFAAFLTVFTRGNLSFLLMYYRFSDNICALNNI